MSSRSMRRLAGAAGDLEVGDSTVNWDCGLPKPRDHTWLGIPAGSGLQHIFQNGAESMAGRAITSRFSLWMGPRNRRVVITRGAAEETATSPIPLIIVMDLFR